ncbi:hypothetical protein F5H01DRAFT_100386 [Linnemannia elongata]|nr:hypothetical protein F5H01DRAFT_100386 [Linnemannia elongata]
MLPFYRLVVVASFTPGSLPSLPQSLSVKNISNLPTSNHVHFFLASEPGSGGTQLRAHFAGVETAANQRLQTARLHSSNGQA